MKKAFWLASVVGLAVAAWATVESVPVQASGSYAAEQINSEESLARRGGSSGGSYGSSGGRRSRGSHGSSGGRHRRGGSSGGSHG